MHLQRNKKKSGFTLIEVLIVIGIISILATIVLIAINPTRQFKVARDAQRTAHLISIMNNINQNMLDHGGVFTCDGAAKAIPTAKTNIAASDGFDIAPCLIPTYMSSLPIDPSKPGASFQDEDSYDLKYSIEQDSYGRITLSADSEVNPTVAIKATR